MSSHVQSCPVMSSRVQSCPVMKSGILIHVMLKHTFLMGTGVPGGKAAGA